LLSKKCKLAEFKDFYLFETANGWSAVSLLQALGGRTSYAASFDHALTTSEETAPRHQPQTNFAGRLLHFGADGRMNALWHGGLLHLIEEHLHEGTGFVSQRQLVVNVGPSSRFCSKAVEICVLVLCAELQIMVVELNKTYRKFQRSLGILSVLEYECTTKLHI
jgi:hypothetical protein